MKREIVVTYTTRYRDGGDAFERIANTLARERAALRGLQTRVERVESKAAFLTSILAQPHRQTQLAELHFVGHSGMYGPMFGTTSWPEQLSPHEWRLAEVPWAEGAEAYFHACRTARWFAPFFARTQRVPAHGFHGYTSFSTEPQRFAPELWPSRPAGDLFAIAIDGRKSHGLLGSARKYTGLAKPEPMLRFEPDPIGALASYDAVAADYDATFDDIRVRADEWRFVSHRVPRGARVLDIGCGNGALLHALAPRVSRGAGVDASAAMVEHATARFAGHPQLSAHRVDSPTLPFDDATFDVVVSMLSFRYLDWDPILREIVRVARPGARLLVVDMVASPADVRDMPRLIRDKLRAAVGELQRPTYRASLRNMVSRDAWRDMVKYNPIRAEHEYRWFLGSRFPAGRLDVLNVGATSKVLGFDSGPLESARLVPQSFP